MSDRTPREIYELARRLARHRWGSAGRVWKDNEKGWTGDRCLAGYWNTSGDRHIMVRGADWWEVVKELQSLAAPPSGRCAACREMP